MAVSDETRRAYERAADELCRAFAAPAPVLSKTSEAPVIAVNGDGTLDVGYGGAVLTVRMTTACDGVEAGDTVLLTAYGQMLYATGVLSTGNPHYVSQRITDFETNFSSYADNQIPTVYKSGGLCVIAGAIKNSASFTPGSSGVRMARLPEGFAPAQDYRTVCQGSGMYRYMLIVNKAGQILCARYGNTTNREAAANSWFVLSGAWAVG